MDNAAINMINSNFMKLEEHANFLTERCYYNETRNKKIGKNVGLLTIGLLIGMYVTMSHFKTIDNRIDALEAEKSEKSSESITDL